MKQRVIEIIALAVLLMLLTLILSVLTGCNPVKKVIQDPQKFEKVKNEVIRRGLCANDTITVTKSDTLVLTDSIFEERVDIYSTNDTVYIERVKTNNFTKNIYIRDTIKAVVVDNARVRLLQADSAALSQKAIEWKGKAEERLSWLLMLLAAIGLFIFFKYKP